MAIIMTYLWSFLVGGAFCLAAQLLIDRTKLTPARILVGYVCAGALISAVGLYEPLIEFAGCGASVPLTGFGHLLVKGTREAVEERGLLGALTGGLTATSAGIAAALIFGFIAAMLFKGRPK